MKWKLVSTLGKKLGIVLLFGNITCILRKKKGKKKKKKLIEVREIGVFKSLGNIVWMKNSVQLWYNDK